MTNNLDLEINDLENYHLGFIEIFDIRCETLCIFSF